MFGKEIVQMTKSHKIFFMSAASVTVLSLITLQAFGSQQVKTHIANQIKADVALIVAGINAHDVDKATQFDSSDIITMESGRPPSRGLAEEKEGLSQAFVYAPSWRLNLVEEEVDVSESGDLAIYRSTYNEESVEDGVPMTHRVNYIAEFRRQPKEPFQVVWSIVSSIEKSHKK
jgi:ketosteroid isomerase-like protein